MSAMYLEETMAMSAQSESAPLEELNCSRLAQSASRELTAFFNAVVDLFGIEWAETSAKEWLQEFSSRFPHGVRSERGCRLITIAVAARLAERIAGRTAKVMTQIG